MQGVPRDPRGETNLEAICRDPRNVEEKIIYASIVILRIMALSEDQRKIANGASRSTALALAEGCLCLLKISDSGVPWHHVYTGVSVGSN